MFPSQQQYGGAASTTATTGYSYQQQTSTLPLFLQELPQAANVTPSTAAYTSSMHANKPTRPQVKTVAVIGGTGRTGALIVRLLIARGCRVRVLVRSMDKAHREFAQELSIQRQSSNQNLEFILGSLGDMASLERLLLLKPQVETPDPTTTPNPVVESALRNQAVDGVIVASGSLAPLGIFNRANAPYNVDYLGMQNILRTLNPPQQFSAPVSPVSTQQANTPPSLTGPNVILISTVGMMRPHRWISFLLENFGGEVMRWKAAGENLLRTSGLPYAIVRAGLLKNSHVPLLTSSIAAATSPMPSATPVTGGTATVFVPESSSPITTSTLSPVQFSETIIADHEDRLDGWISRRDLAVVCVEALLNEAATFPEKTTFEVIASAHRVNDTCSDPTFDPARLLAYVNQVDPSNPPKSAYHHYQKHHHV